MAMTDASQQATLARVLRRMASPLRKRFPTATKWLARQVRARLGALPPTIKAQNWQRHFGKVFVFADWATDTLGDRPVDICIVHDSLALEAARSICEAKGCALVFDAVEYPDYAGRFGGMAQSYDRDKRGHALVLAHERHIHEIVDVLIVGTRGVKDWFAANDRLPAAAIVRNCLDFQEAPDDRRIRDDCGLAPEDRLILLPNSVHMSPYIAGTFEALKYLPANVHIATMGNTHPDVRQALVKELEAAGVAHRAHFLPVRAPDDLIEYRSGADFSVIALDPVYPTFRTALPNRVFESIMARHPLAIPDLPYIREVVEEFDMGVVFRSADPQEIAAGLQAMLDRLPHYKANVEKAAQALCWKNEQQTFLDALAPVMPAGKKLSIVCVANKKLTTNRRVYRHVRTLAALGHDVQVLSLNNPVESLRVDGVEYLSMRDDDPHPDRRRAG